MEGRQEGGRWQWDGRHISIPTTDHRQAAPAITVLCFCAFYILNTQEAKEWVRIAVPSCFFCYLGNICCVCFSLLSRKKKEKQTKVWQSFTVSYRENFRVHSFLNYKEILISHGCSLVDNCRPAERRAMHNYTVTLCLSLLYFSGTLSEKKEERDTVGKTKKLRENYNICINQDSKSCFLKYSFI